MTTTLVGSIGVVVVTQGDASTLERCLRSVRDVAERASALVTIVVVADACDDDSAEVARAMGCSSVIEIQADNAGRARAVGTNRAIDDGAWWTAHVDAHSTVDAQWLERQLVLAEAGADAVVADDVAGQYVAGVRSSFYRVIGGFSPLRFGAHDDLARRLRSSGGLVIPWSHSSPDGSEGGVAEHTEATEAHVRSTEAAPTLEAAH